MSRKSKWYGSWLAIMFVLFMRCVLSVLGRSSYPEGWKKFFFNNEALADVSTEFFWIFLFLVALKVAGRFIESLKHQLLRHMEKSDSVNLFWYGNVFFLIAVIACVIGIALIGGGVVFTCVKMDNGVIALMFATGIVFEVVAICFGFLYYSVLKQITSASQKE